MKEIYLKPFEDYLIEIRVTKANGTFRFYENHLLHFGCFLHESKVFCVTDIDKSVTVAYLELLRNTVENSTINKRVGIIKRCLKFYEIKDHYIYTVPKFKEKKRSFSMITDVDLKRIINYVGLLDNSVDNNLMYQVIIFLLVNTGVRLTELYNIEKKNVNLKENEILLTKTKNGKDRIVFFRPVITDVLKMMLAEKHDHKFLIHNRLKNRPVNYSDIKYLFQKIKDKLLIKKLHPHMFRHTFATKLLQAGVDLKTVMDLMGHNNLATTQRYQHSDKGHAKKTYLKRYRYE